MRVLVTGGLGYLGAHVAETFAARGDEVRLLDRDAPADDQRDWVADFELASADISSADGLAGACDGVDLVVHAAALNQPGCAADPARALSVNALGTRNLLEAAATSGVRRFVYLSTFHVYGTAAAGVLDESVPPRPTTDYGVTKLAGEGYCHRAAATTAMECFALRPANGFGPPVHASADCWMLAVNDFCRQAHATGEIVLSSPGAAQRAFVALSDVVSAIAIVSDAAAPDEPGAAVLNVGAGPTLSIRALAALTADVCAEAYGRPVTVRLPDGAADVPEDAPVDFRFASLTALGYRPLMDMRSGVREVASFVAAHIDRG